VRLHQVDAPETEGLCRASDGTLWPCGQVGAQILRGNIEGHNVYCEQVEKDAYGRTVARCWKVTKDGSRELIQDDKHLDFVFNNPPPDQPNVPSGTAPDLSAYESGKKADLPRNTAKRLRIREADPPPGRLAELAMRYPLRRARTAAAPEDPKGFWSELTNSFKHAISAGAGSLGAQAMQVIGIAGKSPTLLAKGREIESNIEKDPDWGWGKAPEFTDVREVESVSDALQFAGGSLGSGLGYMAWMFGSGGVAGVAAKGAVRLAGATSGRLAGQVGGVAGGGGASGVMALGEVFSQARDELVQDDVPQEQAEERAAWLALKAAPLIASLDYGGMVTAFGKATAQQVRHGFVKSVAKGAARGVSIEGSTEALQTAVAEVATAIETGNADHIERAWNVLNAGIAGAVVGAPLGAAGGAVREARPPEEPPTPVTPGATPPSEIPPTAPDATPTPDAPETVMQDTIEATADVPPGTFGPLEDPQAAASAIPAPPQPEPDPAQTAKENTARFDADLSAQDVIDAATQTFGAERVEELRTKATARAAETLKDSGLVENTPEHDTELKKRTATLMSRAIKRHQTQEKAATDKKKAEEKAAVDKKRAEERAAREQEKKTRTEGQQTADRDKRQQQDRDAYVKAIADLEAVSPGASRGLEDAVTRDARQALLPGFVEGDTDRALRVQPETQKRGRPPKGEEVREGSEAAFRAQPVKRAPTKHELSTLPLRMQAARKAELSNILQQRAKLMGVLSHLSGLPRYKDADPKRAQEVRDQIHRLDKLLPAARAGLRVAEEKLAQREALRDKEDPKRAEREKQRRERTKRIQEEVAKNRERRAIEKVLRQEPTPQDEAAIERARGLPQASFTGLVSRQATGAFSEKATLKVAGAQVGMEVLARRGDGKGAVYKVVKVQPNGSVRAELQEGPVVDDRKMPGDAPIKVVAAGGGKGIAIPEVVAKDPPKPKVTTWKLGDPLSDRVSEAVTKVLAMPVSDRKRLALPGLPPVPSSKGLSPEVWTAKAAQRQVAIQDMFAQWYKEPERLVATLQSAYTKASEAWIREKALSALRSVESALRGGMTKLHALTFLTMEMGVLTNESGAATSRQYSQKSIAELGEAGGALRVAQGEFLVDSLDLRDPHDLRLYRGLYRSEGFQKEVIRLPGWLAKRLRTAMADVVVVEESCAKPTPAKVEHKDLDPDFHTGAVVFDTGEPLTESGIEALAQTAGSVSIRTTEGCSSEGGVCATCCGHFKAYNGLPAVGRAFGKEVADSLTEPFQQDVISSFKNAALLHRVISLDGTEQVLEAPHNMLQTMLGRLPADRTRLRKGGQDTVSASVQAAHELASIPRLFDMDFDPSIVRTVGTAMTDANRTTYLPNPQLEKAQRGSVQRERNVEALLDEAKRRGELDPDVTLQDLRDLLREPPPLEVKARELAREDMRAHSDLMILENGVQRMPYANEPGYDEFRETEQALIEAYREELAKGDVVWNPEEPQWEILDRIRELQVKVDAAANPQEKQKLQVELEKEQDSLIGIEHVEMGRKNGLFDKIRDGKWRAPVYAYLKARPQDLDTPIDHVGLPQRAAYSLFSAGVLKRMGKLYPDVSREELNIQVGDALEAAAEGRTLRAKFYAQVVTALKEEAKTRPVTAVRYPLTHRHNTVTLWADIHDDPTYTLFHAHQALMSGYAGDFDGDGYKITAAKDAKTGAELLKTRGAATHRVKLGDGSAQMMPTGSAGEGLTYLIESEGWAGVVKRLRSLKRDKVADLVETAAKTQAQGPGMLAGEARKSAGRVGYAIATAPDAATSLEAFRALWVVGKHGNDALLKLPGAVDTTLLTKNTAVDHEGLLFATSAVKTLETGRKHAPPRKQREQYKKALVHITTIEGKRLGRARPEDVPVHLIFDPITETYRRTTPAGSWTLDSWESARVVRRSRKLSKRARTTLSDWTNQVLRQAHVGPEAVGAGTAVPTLDVRFATEGYGGSFTMAGAMRGVATVALDEEAWVTVGHEMMHFLRQAGFYTPAQWALMEAQAKRSWMKRYNIKERYPNLAEAEQLEEAVAERFGEWLSAGASQGGLPLAIHKLMRALRKLLRVLRRKLWDANVYTWEDMFDAASDGRLARQMAAGASKPEARATSQLGHSYKSLSPKGIATAIMDDGVVANPSVAHSVGEYLSQLMRSFHRTSAVPHTKEMAQYHVERRKARGAVNYALQKGVDAVRSILGGLSSERKALLARIAIVFDAYAAKDDQGDPLQHPWWDLLSEIGVSDLKAEREKMKALLKADKELAEAYRRYGSYMQSLLELQVEAGILSPELREESGSHYFHRQVLSRLAVRRAIKGRHSEISVPRAFRRKGSTEPINSRIEQVLLTYTMDTYKKLAMVKFSEAMQNGRYNVEKHLKRAAIFNNFERMKRWVETNPKDPRTKDYERVHQMLTSKTLTLRERLDKALSGPEGEHIRASVPYTVKPVLESFLAGKAGREINRTQDILALLGWITTREWSPDTQDIADIGVMSLNLMMARRSVMQSVLKHTYLDPYKGDRLLKDLPKLLPELEEMTGEKLDLGLKPGETLEDYELVALHPKWGGERHYEAAVFDEELFEIFDQKFKAFSADAKSQGAPEAMMEAAKELLATKRTAVVTSGTSTFIIVRKELAEDLNKDPVAHAQESWFMRPFHQGTIKYKSWILTNFMRVIPYNVTNMIGDADAALGAAPSLLLTREGLNEVKKAVRDLKDMAYSDKPTSAELQELIRQGVIGGGQVESEIVQDKLRTLYNFEDLADEAAATGDVALDAAGINIESKTRNVTKWLVGGELQKATQLRENVLRLALYRHIQNRAKKLAAAKRLSTDPARRARQLDIDRSFARQELIHGVQDLNDQIALFVNKTFGDYQDTSVAAEELRRFGVPFVGFMHVNFGRYWNLTRNFGRVLLRKDSTSYERGWTAASWAAATVSRVFMYTVAKEVLNAVMETVSPCGGDSEAYHDPRPTLSFGCWGGRRFTIRAAGSVSELLSWVGLGDVRAWYQNYMTGRMDLWEIPLLMGEAAVNRVAGSVNPIKTFAEAAAGVSVYPDITSPRPIAGGLYGRVRHVFDDLVGSSYTPFFDLTTGQPGQLGPDMGWSNVNAFLPAIGLLVRDADRISYQYIQSKGYDWRDRVRPESGGARHPGRAGYLLDQYAIARRLKDRSAERKFRMLYYKQRVRDAAARGATYSFADVEKDIARELKRKAPLSMLSDRDRESFMLTLTPAERRDLARARAYAFKTYGYGNSP